MHDDWDTQHRPLFATPDSEARCVKRPIRGGIIGHCAIRDPAVTDRAPSQMECVANAVYFATGDVVRGDMPLARMTFMDAGEIRNLASAWAAAALAALVAMPDETGSGN